MTHPKRYEQWLVKIREIPHTVVAFSFAILPVSAFR